MNSGVQFVSLHPLEPKGTDEGVKEDGDGVYVGHDGMYLKKAHRAQAHHDPCEPEMHS